jgi:hypothetical protein
MQLYSLQIPNGIGIILGTNQMIIYAMHMKDSITTSPCSNEATDVLSLPASVPLLLPSAV